MAHEIYQVGNGHSMAFVGDTPWHGLGQKIDPDSSLEIWAQEAYLDWTIEEKPLYYQTGQMDALEYNEVESKKILLRSDNNTPLSVVSDKYQVVQPLEVLEFFKDLIETGGFRMHTAGSMLGGKKVWALAEIGQEAKIMGNDRIGGFLLLATSADGTLATTGQFTTVRVVCNNTLGFAVKRGESGSERAIKIHHLKKFDHEEVKRELGLAGASFNSFIEKASNMSEVHMDDEQAFKFFFNVYKTAKNITTERFTAEEHKKRLDTLTRGQITKLMKIRKEAPGQDLKSSTNTVWGAVNAITYMEDHFRRGGRNGQKLNSAWFGKGNRIKNLAFSMAEDYVAQAA